MQVEHSDVRCAAKQFGDRNVYCFDTCENRLLFAINIAKRQRHNTSPIGIRHVDADVICADQNTVQKITIFNKRFGEETFSCAAT